MKEEFLTLENKPTEVPREKPSNIILFDVSGKIVARAGTDVPFLKKSGFFELLSDGEVEFFERNSRAFGVKKLLLESNRGPLLVFCSMFAETGLFAAVVFHTPRETLRDFWKYGFWSDTLVSPTLREKTLPRKVGRIEDIDSVADCVGRLTSAFDFSAGKLPLNDSEWMLSILHIIICNLARSFGCEISLRKAQRILLSESWVFSMPSFSAIMACLMSLVTSSSVEGKAKVELFEEDGRIFVCLYTTLTYWREKDSKGHSCQYSELAACAKVAERHDLLLDIVLGHKEEGAELSVRFSPEYQDIAMLGFKHPIRFDG